MAKKRAQSEYRLHVAVVAHIESAFPHITFTHAGKGRDETHAHFLSKMGYKAGTPDLLLWYKGRAMAIELKSGSAQSSNQKTFERGFTDNGGLYAVCTSVTAAHLALIRWGCEPIHHAVKEPDMRTDSEKHRDALTFYQPLRP